MTTSKIIPNDWDERKKFWMDKLAEHIEYDDPEHWDETYEALCIVVGQIMYEERKYAHGQLLKEMGKEIFGVDMEKLKEEWQRKGCVH